MSHSITYQPALDGLRAVAVAMVVVFHANTNLLPGGWIGVDVFFVLSGYLITSTLGREQDRSGKISLPRFYMRRTLRLLPAFWCLLAFVMLTPLFRVPKQDIASAVLFAGTYMINWARAFHTLPEDLLGHTWSLAVEEQFYLVWPALFILIRRRTPIRWIAAGIVAVLAWRVSLYLTGANFYRAYLGFDTRADALLLGCLLAFLPSTSRLAAWASKSWPVPLAAIAFIALRCYACGWFVQTIGFTVTALLAAWLIIGIRTQDRLREVLSKPALVYTGKISYGIYLWHWPLMLLLREPFGMVGVVAAAALSYALASVSYETIERQCLSIRVWPERLSGAGALSTSGIMAASA